MAEDPQKPKPQSAAGGAVYHSLKATKAWKQYVTEIQKHASHTVAERERKDRDQAKRTTYAKAAEAKQEG